MDIQSVQIGKYHIYRSSNDNSKIAVYQDDGEGGDFSEKELEAWLKVFYDKNF
jgi:hypothetical protein